MKLLSVCLYLLAGTALLAQQPQQARIPHIGYVYPPGGQRGKSFQVIVGGQYLDSTYNAISSGSGIAVSVVEINKPIPEKRFNELRDYVEEARKMLLGGTNAATYKPTPRPASPSPSASPAPSLSGSAQDIRNSTIATPIFTARPIGSPSSSPAASPSASASVTPHPSPAALAQASATPTASPSPSLPPITALPPLPWGPEKIAYILKIAGATDAEIQKFFELRKNRNDPKRQQNMQIAELVTLKVTLAQNAPQGPAELRLVTNTGVSNPVTFCVGDLPELNTEVPRNGSLDTAVNVTPPTVLDGQILPGDVHDYTFQATKGQHLVAQMQARDLVPYIADAVPGWFQPALTLYNAKKQPVAYADHFRFRPDPILIYTVAETGTYYLEVRDTLYRGREDFVYRVSLGQIPYITDIYPLGGKIGAPARIALTGDNLTNPQAQIPSQPVEGIYKVPAYSGGLATTGPAFQWDTLPAVEAAQPTTPAAPQKISIPAVINGRIAHAGDIHAFAIPCRAGQKITGEVFARRLDSPLDSVLKVLDPAGHQIAFNDDAEGNGLLTHSADSRLTFTAPTAGDYTMLIADAQSAGGPEYAYRLRVTEPGSDFALRISPSGINARPGMTVPLAIDVQRGDGWQGDIMLDLQASKPGFILNGGLIPAGQNRIRATITYPQTGDNSTAALVINGYASIGGRLVSHTAVPCDDMIQAFMNHHLVPAREFVAAVSGTNRGRPPITLVGPKPLVLKPGSSAQAIFSLEGRAPFAAAVTTFQLSEPPDGVSIGTINATEDGAAITFAADKGKTKPGTKGNLLVEAFVERNAPAVNGKPAGPRKFSIGYLPAIPFQIAAQ